MSLFQNSVLNKYLKGLEYEKATQAFERFTSHFHNPIIQENIRNSKEEQYQDEFLIALFVNVLGYTKNPTSDFNLTTELKNIKGSKKTDGAILKGDKALAVINLKGTNTTDLSKVETQAFGYKNNQLGCKYVITSNFEKLRFYIDNRVDFEEFNLFQLSKERFNILWLCLSSEYLLEDIPKKIKDESLTQEENVTKKLYKDYASFRNEIFDAIRKENSEYDKLTLFKKTQKLLDRFLFIFFAEDRLILPPNSIRSIVNQRTDLRNKYDEYFPLYDRFKKYFGYMNTGHEGQRHDIFAYNGGLFAPDEILDNIKINDDLLYKHTGNLSNYDFESEVSVNILGHIFEHSLNDIDEIQAEIHGIATKQSKTKRKKDGVFYTPEYITKYIVDNTVGKLCEEKKTELDIHEVDYEKERKGSQKATLKKLKQKLEDYRKWLLQITICDPACGSGAFLNQALEFLIAEHRYIDELQAKLLGDAMVLSEVENAILENNIYGVDINEQSVEIAKLSLWLRTAQKGRELTALNNNIKCGNSLIDDPTVAGEKAFYWQNEFPEVFAKGGFDIIIGNPPYVIIFDKSKEFLESKFHVFKRNNDLYTAFYNLSIDILNESGFLGFITPNSFIKGDYFKELRKRLSKYQIISIVDFNNYLVFEDAYVFSAIIVLNKIESKNSWSLYSDLDTIKGKIESKSDHFIPISPILKKLNKYPKFFNFFEIKDVGFNYWTKGRGKVRGESIGSRILYSGKKQKDDDIPYIKGSNFNRYTRISCNNYLKSNYREFLNDNDIFTYNLEILEVKPKIVYRQTSSSLIGTLDRNGNYCDKTVHVIINKLEKGFDLAFVLGLFNSKLMNYLYKLTKEETGRSFAQVKTVNIKKLPFAKPKDVFYQNIINKVQLALTFAENIASTEKKFLDLLISKHLLSKPSKKLQNWHELDVGEFLIELEQARKKSAKENGEEYIQLSLTGEAEWLQYFNEQKQKATKLKAEIKKTDREIDQMVYELYGLTEEEIAIVEEATK